MINYNVHRRTNQITTTTWSHCYHIRQQCNLLPVWGTIVLDNCLYLKFNKVPGFPLAGHIFYLLQIINIPHFLEYLVQPKWNYLLYSSKFEIHRDAYHKQQSPLLPYKVTVESAACLGCVSVLAVGTSTKSGLQDQLYQKSHVKSVPEKWIKSGTFSLSYTKKVGSLIHVG